MSEIVRWGSSTALRNLGRRKTRAALSIIGISISVLTITTIISIGLGMQAEVETFVGDVLGGSIILRSSETSLRPNIPEYVVGILDDIEGVNKAVPAIMAITRAGDQLVFLIGVEPNLIKDVFQVTFSEGRMITPNEDDGIMILSTTADTLKLGLNSSLYLTNAISGHGEVYKVVGIMDSMGSADMMIESMGGSLSESSILGGAGFTTFRAAQNLAEAEGYVSMVYIHLNDLDDLESIENIIESMFVDAKIIKQDTILENAGNILDLVNAVLLGLSGISLIVGSLGVMNTIMVSVHERQREIGVLKAIGAERSHILFMFIMEALYMGLMGGALGSILGTGGMVLLNDVTQRFWDFKIPIVMSWTTYAAAVSIAVFVSVLAGLYPSWSAANIKPVEAMRYE